MAVAIRKNLKNFIALLLLIVVSAGVTLFILQEQRLRIPVLEERPFELKAELKTAQAVVPGQGQSVRIAGVKVGDVQSVDLEGGRAVVTFGMDRSYLPIYKDATILLRPQTGLKDMFFQMDPGTATAGPFEEGDTVPVANTAPDVNLDEILEALDNDTQAYLRLLLVGGGQGLDGRGRDLGKVLGSLGPLNRDFKRLSSKVAQRRGSLKTLIHNFNQLTGEVGKAEDDLTDLVRTSNVALGAIAERDPDVQRAVSVLPETLTEARNTLASLSDFAQVLGPTLDNLQPFAQNLPELNASVRRLSDNSLATVRDEVRPFVRQAQEVTPDLRVAARELADATPDLTTLAGKLNRLGNMAAYNPNGAESAGEAGRDEGYLYWAAWLGHNGNSIFEAQDGTGLYRRIYFTVGCTQAFSILNVNALAPALTGLSQLFDPGGPFAGISDASGCPALQTTSP